ncbi:HAD family phosphatase [Paralimibaculum aggregatum]|uniref:HAD family phosphatase n=1 Tax=Paralimibaculum aggregatum TaxID=3036245 RepID=A0ABQ6LR02_9RHOB|nr:HAD family phosphatase [Limibaculum sp. NKW23]
MLIGWNPRLVYPDLTDAQVRCFFQEVGFQEWNVAQDRGRSWAEGVAELIARYPHRAPLIERFRRDWHRAVPGPVDGMEQLLDTLDARGVARHAITNFSVERWIECQARFPFLANGFGVTVVSGRERMVKPDPRIYRLMLTRAGLAPEDCIFVDDSAANVATARAVGMEGHEFRTAAGLASDLRRRGLLA